NLLLRPANFPAGTPGVGHVTVKAGPHKIAVLNLMGRVFMLPIDCPFRKADEILPELRKETPIVLVDMHCEATSESLAMGWSLDGKVVAQKVLDDVRAGVARLKDRSGTAPTLAVVLVGDFAPSKVYVANKKRAADTVGIASEDHIHPEGLDRAALLALLRQLNADPKVHGILLQLPLPKGLDEDEAIAAIAPEKDADGLHPTNLGRLLAGAPS